MQSKTDSLSWELYTAAWHRDPPMLSKSAQQSSGLALPDSWLWERDGEGFYTHSPVSAALYGHLAEIPRVTRPNMTGDQQVTHRKDLVLSMRLYCPVIPFSTRKHTMNGAMPPLRNPKRHKFQISIFLRTCCPVVMISSMNQTRYLLKLSFFNHTVLN